MKKIFSEPLKTFKLNQLITRVSNPVNVDKDKLYTQIGIRSHGKGIFIKDAVTGEELGDKRVFWIEPDCLIVNIVFAWEHAVAKTTQDLQGLIASHRFPMYKMNNKIDLNYLVYYLLTPKGKRLLEAASPGGAGRNKTLNQKDFLELKIQIPNLQKQQKISDFLIQVDKKIQLQQEKVNLLKEQKKGYMQKIFKQEMRFKDENGREYSEWKVKKLKDVTTLANKTRLENPEAYNLLSVKLHLNGVEATDRKPNPTKNGRPYYIRNSGELIIGRQNFHNGGIAIVDENMDGYVASNAISSFNVKNNDNIHYIYLYISQVDYYKRVGYFMEGTGQKEISEASLSDLIIEMPELKEQEKIADFLFEFDKKVHHEQQKLDLLKEQKKGFMQQMFA